jgi:hypothetical protein
MKRLEGIGLAREQAEGLTHYLTSVMCTNREKLEELFVAKVTLEKVSRRCQATWEFVCHV